LSIVLVQKILLNVGNADQLAEAVAAISLKSLSRLEAELRWQLDPNEQCTIRNLEVHIK
jgi:hypothetical protein